MTYTISDAQLTIILILVAWELIWKAIALWRAARYNQPVWFGLLLVLNTAGILPIIYVLMTSQRDEAAADGPSSKVALTH